MKEYLPQKVDAEKYCEGCRHNLNFSCDILGPQTLRKKAICYHAGYRELKVTTSSVRVYANRRGDKYDTEQGR